MHRKIATAEIRAARAVNFRSKRTDKATSILFVARVKMSINQDFCFT